MGKNTDKKNPETFQIYTLGCKTNQSESDDILRKLSLAGLKPSGIGRSPDIIIINTCTVTSAADKKSRQLIRRVKKQFPSAIYVVTGCFTVFNKDFFKKNSVDLIVSNSQKSRIIQMLDICGSPVERHYSDLHSRALVKIQDGCEQKCSYCIVPFVRGNYHSRQCREIIKEIIQIEKEGLEEVVLTGIHIGKYGIDLANKRSDINTLAGLIQEILEKTSIKRIRLSSLEINELTENIIHLMSAADGHIARHLHIPLQSGSNRILKRMNRPYSREYFIGRIKKLKTYIPGIALTTDVIAGFPGETEKDFLQTLEAVEDIGFSKVHVFKYSPREHTEAFLMNGRVEEKEISLRSERLRQLGDRLRDDFICSLKAEYLHTVCEEYDEDKKIACGVAEQYVKVYFDQEIGDFASKRGRIIRVLAKKPWREGIFGIAG